MRIVIIVLGNGFGSDGGPCEITIARLNLALEQKAIHEKAGNEVVLCLTGYTPFFKQLPITLAECMRDYLLSLNTPVPKYRITFGFSSDTKWLEAWLVVEQIALDRFDRIILISSDWDLWFVRRKWARAAHKKKIPFSMVPVRGTGNKVWRLFGKLFGNQEDREEIVVPLKCSA